MTERLTFMQVTGSLWVKDIEEGKLLRPASIEDKAALEMESEDEFWRSADALVNRVFAQFKVDGDA